MVVEFLGQDTSQTNWRSMEIQRNSSEANLGFGNVNGMEIEGGKADTEALDRCGNGTKFHRSVERDLQDAVIGC